MYTQGEDSLGIFVIGVILNELCVSPRLLDIPSAKIPLNSSFETMSAKLKLTVGELFLDILERFHVTPEIRGRRYVIPRVLE